MRIPPEILAQLHANAVQSQAAARAEARFDPVPLVKLFSPVSAATWLATELDSDGDTLFGLADLGFGCPELGCFSLDEITSVQLPYGLRVERDAGFRTPFALSTWAAWARAHGSILWAETLLRRVALSGAAPDLPADPDGPERA
jgi:hypothetical protein